MARMPDVAWLPFVVLGILLLAQCFRYPGAVELESIPRLPGCARVQEDHMPQMGVRWHRHDEISNGLFVE